MRDEGPSGDGPGDQGGGGASPLRDALRRARVEAAERADVVFDLKQAELARLETLRDALAPVFADVPPEIDLFDVGLVPGDRPRLFIDMVSFVEMGRDRRLYRLMRDGRHGRAVAAESEQVEPIVAAVTEYVARRLVERARLLADEETVEGPLDAPPPAAGPDPDDGIAPAETPAPPRSGRARRVIAILAAFVVGGALGAAVVGGLVLAAVRGLLPGVGGM